MLAKEQWGGRPGKTAIDLVMSKEMMITTYHLLKKNGAITDVDATACYDRIPPILMWLAYFKAGAPWHLILLFAKALEQLLTTLSQHLENPKSQIHITSSTNF